MARNIVAIITIAWLASFSTFCAASEHAVTTPGTDKADPQDNNAPSIGRTAGRSQSGSTPQDKSGSSQGGGAGQGNNHDADDRENRNRERDDQLPE